MAKVVGAAPFVEPQQKVPLVFLPGFCHNIRFCRMTHISCFGNLSLARYTIITKSIAFCQAIKSR